MSLLGAYIITFIASFCTLVIEMVAGRILAPFVGVSIYTWTSIIGVILAGISVGAYIGGRLVDRFPSRKTLGWLLLLSGIMALSRIPYAEDFHSYIDHIFHTGLHSGDHIACCCEAYSQEPRKGRKCNREDLCAFHIGGHYRHFCHRFFSHFLVGNHKDRCLYGHCIDACGSFFRFLPFLGILQKENDH